MHVDLPQYFVVCIFMKFHIDSAFSIVKSKTSLFVDTESRIIISLNIKTK